MNYHLVMKIIIYCSFKIGYLAIFKYRALHFQEFNIVFKKGHDSLPLSQSHFRICGQDLEIS